MRFTYVYTAESGAEPEIVGCIYVAHDEAGFPGVYDADGALLWDTFKTAGATLEEWIEDMAKFGGATVTRIN